MRDELKSKIDQFAQRRDERKRVAAEATQRRESEEATFYGNYLKVRDAVIRPAMEELGEAVKAKGLKYRIIIEEGDEGPGRAGVFKPPRIEITFRDNFGFSGYEGPCFAVICSANSQTVRFHESTIGGNRGGHAGSAGEARLDEITTDYIQAKMMKVIEALF